MTGDGEEADRLWAAIADPTRQQLLDLILASGDATATALARDLPITRQGIAKHLAVLERAGLVEATRTGREVRFAVRRGPPRPGHQTDGADRRRAGTSASPRSSASPRPATDPFAPGSLAVGCLRAGHGLRRGHPQPRLWLTTSTLCPSGSSTNAP